MQRNDIRKIQILMLNYEFPPIGGGSGNATYQILRELSCMPEFYIDLVTSGLNDNVEVVQFSDRIRVFRLPVGKVHRHYWSSREILRWSVGAYRFVRHLTSEIDYDLCHCWSGWPSGIVGFLMKSRMPYLVGLRGSDVPGYNARLRYLDPLFFRPLSRRVWKHADVVTAVSQNLAALAIQSARELAPVVIHNGIDSRRFRPIEPRNRFTILFVGRLILRKQVMILLRSFLALVTEGENCRLVIAGGGPDRKRLQEFCHRNSIAEHVDFLGETDQKDLAEVYGSASIFVMPSSCEAMSNAVLEAMAAGLPIITTNTGVAEVIEDNGVVLRDADHRLMTEAIRHYLKDSELRDRHGRQSRILAEAMPWLNAARRYVELFHRIKANHQSTNSLETSPEDAAA